MHHIITLELKWCVWEIWPMPVFVNQSALNRDFLKNLNCNNNNDNNNKLFVFHMTHKIHIVSLFVGEIELSVYWCQYHCIPYGTI